MRTRAANDNKFVSNLSVNELTRVSKNLFAVISSEELGLA